MHNLFIAHGEELHTASTSDLEHTLTQPLVALPLFIGVLALLFLGLKKGAGLALDKILLVLMGVLFFVGVLTYSLVPVVSIASLTAGIGLALFFSLAAIAK